MDLEVYKKQFENLDLSGQGKLAELRRTSFDRFQQLGIPGARHEEWKYSRVRPLFLQHLGFASEETSLSSKDQDYRLPDSAQANEIVFVHGRYQASQSRIVSPGLIVEEMETAFQDPRFKGLLETHYNHIGDYLQDGLASLNTAFSDAVFIHVEKEARMDAPLYIYYIQPEGAQGGFAQPRAFIHASAHSRLKVVTRNHSAPGFSTLTNQVMEALVEEAADLAIYQIQDDHEQASTINTVHVRQTGPSEVTSLVVSLTGRMVRNNLHMLMECPTATSHLYGLYVLDGETHVDHHTVADHKEPHCQSNELYKGILDGRSTGVFNGKIFVRPDAQKTNAFQSNRNVLLSDHAQINAKPQLEIFADDVKCSHGCTVGKLDEEALYYLRSRGIPQKAAAALLLQGYAGEVLEKLDLPSLRTYVEARIEQRLNP